MAPEASSDRCFPDDPLVTLPLEVANEALLVYGEVQEALAENRAGAEQPVAFDLDDTVVTGLARTTRKPEDVPQTRQAIAWVLGRLLEERRPVVIVTGRDDEEEAWRDLLRALEEVSLQPLDEVLLRGVSMRCGGAWAGTKIGVTRKVAALRETRAALLVGDLDHLDGRAARQAGIPFIDVGPHWTGRRMGGTHTGRSG